MLFQRHLYKIAQFVRCIGQVAFRQRRQVATSIFFLLTSLITATMCAAAQSQIPCVEDPEITGSYAKLRKDPKTDKITLLRAEIAISNHLVEVYSDCKTNSLAERLAEGFKQQRQDALTECMRIASDNNCEVSPLNRAAETSQKAGPAPAIAAAAPADRSVSELAKSDPTLEDLRDCKSELTAFRNAAVKINQPETLKYNCNDSFYDCNGARQFVAEIAAQDPVSFFWKGNESCQDWKYPCFGKASLDIIARDPGLVQRTLSAGSKPAFYYQDGEPVLDATLAERCIIQAWKRRVSGGSASNRKTRSNKADNVVILADSGNLSAGSSNGSTNLDRSATAAATDQTTRIHDPTGEANKCIRPNPGVSYGGFTNICSYSVSYIHCYTGVAANSGDSYAFHCDRPGGLWASSTTAGNVRPGRTDNTSIPKGAHIFWIACRSPFAIRDAKFDGQALRGSCVRP